MTLSDLWEDYLVIPAIILGIILSILLFVMALGTMDSHSYEKQYDGCVLYEHHNNHFWFQSDLDKREVLCPKEK